MWKWVKRFRVWSGVKVTKKFSKINFWNNGTDAFLEVCISHILNGIIINLHFKIIKSNVFSHIFLWVCSEIVLNFLMGFYFADWKKLEKKQNFKDSI